MRCLVTGAAGFIGSHLAERLLAEGHEVWGIDNFADFYARVIKERNLEGPRAYDRFALIEKDLLHLDLMPLLEGIDWVFHLAAQAGVRGSWGSDFTRYLDCNVLATQRLLEAVANQPCVRRFVYASSSSVYGETRCLPIQECIFPQPHSPYGVTKLAGEQLCALYARNCNLPIVALRYFTVYGPRQRPDMALHRFCKAIVEHEPLHIFGDGQQSRDFTFVSDIVEANLRAAISDAAVGETFNIAGGARTTLHEVLDLLREISGAQIEYVCEQRQRGDVQDTLADTSRAAHLLGYAPHISLREGLVRQFASIVDLYGAIPGRMVA